MIDKYQKMQIYNSQLKNLQISSLKQSYYFIFPIYSRMVKNLSILIFFYYIILQQVQNIELNQKFSILTTTHSTNGNFETINQFIKFYAEKMCFSSIVQEINVVWNDQMTPESIGIFDRQDFWIVPIYFYRADFNSMNNRYRLAKDTVSDIFFSVDDDVLMSCETMVEVFMNYLQNYKMNNWAIVTNNVQGYSFGYAKNKQFDFIQQKQSSTSEFFSLVSVGATIITRHYLQLYYLKIKEIDFLRKEVVKLNKCEDIFFFGILQHYYPQFLPIYIGSNFTKMQISQKSENNHYNKQIKYIRSYCLNQLSNAFGYNSLRFYQKDQSINRNNWIFQNIQIILYQKIKGFSAQQFQKDDRIQENINETQKYTTKILNLYEQEQTQYSEQIITKKQQSQINNLPENKMILRGVIVILILVAITLIVWMFKSSKQYSELIHQQKLKMNRIQFESTSLIKDIQ